MTAAESGRYDVIFTLLDQLLQIIEPFDRAFMAEGKAVQVPSIYEMKLVSRFDGERIDFL